MPLRLEARMTLSAKSSPAFTSTSVAITLPRFAQSPQTRLNDAMTERSLFS